MKYLKRFNLCENREESKILERFFIDKINFNLIQDIKDISLEYLDDGWALYLSVRSDKISENTQSLMRFKFHHSGWRSGDIFSLIFYTNCSDPDGEWNWNINTNDINIIIEDYKINGIRYEFSIRKKLNGHGESASHNPESNEILKQIRGLNPKENIINR